MSDGPADEQGRGLRPETQCLTEDEVEAFVAGRLARGLEAVEEHLLYCHPCLDRVEEEERLAEGVRMGAMTMPKPVRSERRASWMVLAPIGALAMALLAVAPATMRRFAPEQTVELTAIRADDKTSLAAEATGGKLVLTANVADLPMRASYPGVIVNERADVVAQGNPERDGKLLVWPLGKPLAKGKYWVQIYSPDKREELLREYALTVR